MSKDGKVKVLGRDGMILRCDISESMTVAEIAEKLVLDGYYLQCLAATARPDGLEVAILTIPIGSEPAFN
jgi:hypothetical protein